MTDTPDVLPHRPSRVWNFVWHGFGLLLLSLVTVHSPLLAQTITFYQTGTVPPVTTQFPVVQTSMAWGGVSVGAASTTQTVTVENTGASTASTVVVGFSTGNTGDFSDTTAPVTNCGGSLAAGATCVITVTFTPGASGSRASSLSVSGSNFTTALLSLTGFGTSVVPGTLNWTAPVLPVGATLALTQAQCGDLVQMGATGGEVVTLPAPAVGCSFDFSVTVSNTSASNEIRTDGSSHFLLGAVEHSASGIAPLSFWADGSTIQAIKMDGAHLGGLIGSYFHLVGISATQWEITGRNEGTATMTTAFTATP